MTQRFFVVRSKWVLKRPFALWPVLVSALFVSAFVLGAWARGLRIDAEEEGANVPPFRAPTRVGASLFGMGLGLVVTLAVSRVTTPAAEERRVIDFDLAD